MKVLVTGSAGYIAAHFIASMFDDNHHVTGIDNFSNSSMNQVKILQKKGGKNFVFVNCDILDLHNLEKIFKSSNFDAVIHFAALKSVPESMKNKEKYFYNNVIGTKNILEQMVKNNVKNIIFSSSAAVYGNSACQPLNEDSKLHPESFYGETKMLCEKEIISNVKKNNLKAIILRYFNPVGFDKAIYHFSEKILSEGSLISNILSVVNGKSDFFEIYGDDYDTADGTAERDYIHIDDLIRSHKLCINHLSKVNNFEIFNVGTGYPISVKEFLCQFSKTNKLNLPYKISKRRLGDAKTSYTCSKKIKENMSFEICKGLESMCADSFKILR